MTSVVAGLAYGTFAVQVILLSGALLSLVKILGLKVPGGLEQLEAAVVDYSGEIIFLQALVATFGSLYMSNVLGWTPCRLCWFQRILIYPVTVISGVGLALGRYDFYEYVLALSIIGIPVSAYHYVVQRIEQFQAAGCSITSTSCSTSYTFYLEYITVPMMALTALIVFLLISWKFRPRAG